MKTIRQTLLVILSVFCICYYFICIAFAHIGVSWLWIWPAAAVFFLIRFFMLKRNVQVPKIVSGVYYTFLALFLILFSAVEFKIVNAMFTVPENNLDYIITLGAAVRNGVATSPLELRIERSYDYLLNNPGTVDIASGGQGSNESVSEAQCIADGLISRGINPERIILEDRSSDTVENISNSFKFIPDNSRTGIVTNSFHIYRAVRTAQLLGHEASGVPAVTYPILGLHYIVREFFAVVQLECNHILGKI